MNLYIQVKDGLPFEHPVLESNLRQTYPLASYKNIPEGFAKFTRILKPKVGPYEMCKSGPYIWCEEGQCFKDNWTVRPMTHTEKVNKIRSVWLSKGGYDSWIVNEDTYEMEAPTAKPDDGQEYEWDEETLSWVLPSQPE